MESVFISFLSLGQNNQLTRRKVIIGPLIWVCGKAEHQGEKCVVEQSYSPQSSKEGEREKGGAARGLVLVFSIP
jgi:hypothetical protein